MHIAIWWIRRDLRIHDNPALHAALQWSDQVLPLFIFDPKLLKSRYVGQKRLAFLIAGLQSLKINLQAHGSDLFVRHGEPLVVLAELRKEFAAVRVFAQEDFSPYAQKRDRLIGKKLPLYLTPGVVIHHPNKILKNDGSPYRIYTPYSKKWRTFKLPNQSPPPPARISSPYEIFGEPLPRSPGSSLLPAGETAAIERLRKFTHGENAKAFAYKKKRNRVDLEGTSGLSPYLRFGMLSPRLAIQTALDIARSTLSNEAAMSVDIWLNELVWREFFVAILYHFPGVRQASFRESYRRIEWANDEVDFQAWCAGRTGFPIIDAAMRQLAQTGWMHNRARMVVASFLTKDLLIDWRWGEHWFMQHLIDGDPAANNGGWQWAAGTGADAAPYFRIFNPVSQSQRHDPNGAYIRRYLPELAQVPDAYIHEPWKMPADVQSKANCLIGREYPAPIVDHRWARGRALEAYRKARR